MLSEMTDILDHLEASGNVPAGYERLGSQWLYQGRYTTYVLDRIEGQVNIAIATASLCHTIEGVLVKNKFEFGWDDEDGDYWYGRSVFAGLHERSDRLSAAASAYRGHFNLGVPNA